MKPPLLPTFAPLLLTLALACHSMPGPPPETLDWGTIDGKSVHLYTLRNDNGLVLKVTDYGAIITELHLPDRDGRLADVVLGFDRLDGYLAGHPYFGCIAGRCANRIAEGRFTLDAKTYQLARNNGNHHLHGGVTGFDKHVWEATCRDTPDGPSIRLERVSPDGEEGYPGELRAAVTYTLTNADELRTEITATTDAPTLCNLAQHTYWNLAGHDSGPIHDHVARFNAKHYLPVDDTLIPTGEVAPTAGTPFDFLNPKPIGRVLARVGSGPVGYDHNLVIDGPDYGNGDGDGDAMRLVCRVSEPESGRWMELHGNQPGCQFYTGNFLDGSLRGKDDVVYRQHQGFCLETQRYPDSIHHPEWPSAVLRPGETYHHVMITRFGAE